MIPRTRHFTYERYERSEKAENRVTPLFYAAAVGPKSVAHEQSVHNRYLLHTSERAKLEREQRRHLNLHLKRRRRERD